MTEQLLPCPFCGGEAHIERVGNRSFSTIYQCNHCGCSLETGEEFNHGRDWNRRAAPANENSAFKIRQHVFKPSGSWWQGFVVGHYSTQQTPDGICVQLAMTNGPVQIYPASALKLLEPHR